ncbi:uncharacterized protein I303_100339 [Kwoniella dejecticola CBS 10117]|uniref:CRAL-TRIO domain-containing protein n=1 Tax=Kwoniella dejecticola CBS 10117 TaxID=1296121 RepID=A0A1A6AES2_9TREE|nr:uncharacterized protein I303_00340 [Kwoniella dejecticola CBS 10117]OBR88523.1 hypothetical protein I303_00340 [Kwoniella dejecticola CBS 10117]
MSNPDSDTRDQPPAWQRFQNTRAEYEAYLPLTQRVQHDLQHDADELRSQEGWDEEEWAGIEEWINDSDSIFRHLRRHRFDENKTLTALLSTLQQRINLSLHHPIPPFPPYTDSPLFFILPLPDHTDRLGRPIAVLTVKEVYRDSDGKLDDLKSYAWWALEMVRRTLRDYWVSGHWSGTKRLGKGGEGLCVLVDANGAGYRNMEVELLPTLLSVGHNNFPGMIESVYVVNAGWTHRSMWNIVKRVLPKSALEKVAFLDDKPSVEAVFDLDKLPQSYGGNHPYTYSISHNPIYTNYSHHPSTDHPFLASRNSSYSSIAEIYYSAPNTPFRSRRNSSAINIGGWRLGGGLRMTKSREANSPIDSPDLAEGDVRNMELEEPAPAKQTAVGPAFHLKSRKDSQKSTLQTTNNGNDRRTLPSNGSAIQRIKSLSDFHLYLSPSRLAHLDLLSDSDPGSDTETTEQSSGSPPRKTLKPALLAEQDIPLSQRRLRPPLRLLGVSGSEGEKGVRTYSDRLQAHHAKVLQLYTGTGDNTPTSSRLGLTSTLPTQTNSPEQDSTSKFIRVIGGSPVNSVDAASDTLEPPCEGQNDHSTSNYNGDVNGNAQAIDEYDRNNPWFGYPVVRIPSPSGQGRSVLRPKFSRNRKRDLIKTLLFLFMLRVQSWRDSLERYLGLNWILTTSKSRRAGRSDSIAPNPTEGLLATAMGSGKSDLLTKRNNVQKDWWWMLIGFLLLRGTWSRLLIAPLESFGWGKEVLGL